MKTLIIRFTPKHFVRGTSQIYGLINILTFELYFVPLVLEQIIPFPITGFPVTPCPVVAFMIIAFKDKDGSVCKSSMIT